MQELAFLLTGLAGAASAVAFAKFPKNTHSLKIIGANPRIQREIAYMPSRTAQMTFVKSVLATASTTDVNFFLCKATHGGGAFYHRLFTWRRRYHYYVVSSDYDGSKRLCVAFFAKFFRRV